MFNKIIYHVAKNHDIPFVDMEAVFKLASDQGIPGNTLFFEHLHPNFNGYRLMARTFFQALYRLQILNPPKPIGWQDSLLSKSDMNTIIDTYKKDYGSVTLIDREIGHLKNHILTGRWPFPERSEEAGSYRPLGDKKSQKIALDYIQHKIFWDQAHYLMAEHFIEQGNFVRARNELRAVNLSYYDNPVPFKKLGDLYQSQEKYADALRNYKMALQRTKDDLNLTIQTGRMLTATKQFKNAIPYLEQALDQIEEQDTFSQEEQAKIHYFIALCRANLKEFSKADYHIAKSLELSPSLIQAQKLKKDLINFRKEK